MLTMRPLLFPLLAALPLLCAQPPATLENTGKPMRVAVECKPDTLITTGLTCSEDEPCPLFLELSAVESTGVRLLIAGNIHTSTVTISSVLLSSADGGKTWIEPFERIPMAALEQMQFAGLENGWISGSIIQNLPRDPFFLLTTDGGKSFSRKPMFEESHNGSIDRFWFENAKTGTALLTAAGPRYELYESMTGGESWSVKQISSTPLTLEMPASTTNTGRRLRADARNRSYNLETKDGGAWQRVASFLVEIGSCK